MATNLSVFRQGIILHVATCPLAIVNDALRKSAIEFCRKSRIWQEDEADLITTVDGTAEYAVASTSSTGEIAGIVELHFDDDNDTEIPSITERELREVSPGWRISSDKPTNYINKDIGTVRLYPIPDDAYAIDGKLWLTPNVTGTTLPDVLNEWKEEIGYGALARLYALPAEAWSSPERSVYYEGRFAKEIKRATAQVNRERSIASATIRPANVYS